MGYGGLLLDEGGRVLLLNPTATSILGAEVGAAAAQACKLEWARGAVKKLLRRSRTRFALETEAWVTVAREGKRDLALHAVPVGEASDVQARIVLILIDLSLATQPKPTVLQKLFGLTPAEERLAILIAGGATPAEIAQETGLSIATVRSQLASVFAKTQTTRQPELVALLARVAILP